MSTSSKDHLALEASDMKFEVAIIPVSDVDRAKRFYAILGWRLDADYVRSDGSRAVQFTPPGSSGSIQLGPGPAARFYLIVNDIETTRAELVARGVDVSEVFHRGTTKDSRLSGPDPERRSYASFVTFDDPDGNNWLVQEVTHRLPGRVSADAATFASSTDLAAALRAGRDHAAVATIPRMRNSDICGPLQALGVLQDSHVGP